MSSLYLIAILPPADLSSQINEIRVQCSEKFGVRRALEPPVNISLYRPFKMEQAFESKMCRMLQSVASGFEPFRQDLENFEAFDMNAVVIRALKNPQMMKLQRSVASIFRKNKLDKQPAGSKNLAFRPHVAIAYRDILPEVFPMLWQEYKDVRFKRNFTNDQFSILKHDGKEWNKIQDFKLSGQKGQLDLF
ncbi:2'-5' RNA ligase family protein [Daejeonella lutea]|uniref:2'-5' RNA ligase n=1 Tax=Daejeonella lutea TaxID=572036 RepID=A0A1T5ARF0_9SPHI|nr:2'-5' RNA ligase family protein [Daejeonella lutea]SKB37407.1 2'-5' RNA ligase [Daejeonella lutea]